MTAPGSPYEAAWRDLHERLIRTSHQLRRLDETSPDDRSRRLRGKREGVDLALSYMDEWERTGITLVPSKDDRGGAS